MQSMIILVFRNLIARNKETDEDYDGFIISGKFAKLNLLLGMHLTSSNFAQLTISMSTASLYSAWNSRNSSRNLLRLTRE